MINEDQVFFFTIRSAQVQFKIFLSIRSVSTAEKIPAK